MYDRIDVVTVRRDSAAAARRIPISLPAQGTEWARVVEGLGVQLKPVIEELGVVGARTKVVYRGR